MNKNQSKYREYILNMLIVTAGSWQATGCKDKALESKFIYLLGEIHPNREIALKALEMHIAGSAAA